MRAWFAVTCLMLVGCEEQRHGVPCYGIGSKDNKIASEKYEVSTTNVVVGVILSETLIVPAVVVATELWCPIQPIPAQQPDAGALPVSP